MLKKIYVTSFIAISIIIGAEVVIRVAGITDFPLYDANNHIGYIPKANQSGKFMGKNDWVFNELSMGTAEHFAPSEKDDILLVGDSIVLGGNQYPQAEKIGPQLSKVSGDVVWPISAGSWGLQNEVTYMSDHPEVIKGIDKIVLVSNSADFDAPSSWVSEFTHPREKPIFASWYLILRQVIKPERTLQPEMAVTPVDPFDALAQFASQSGKPLDIWLYPNKAENADPALWEKNMGPAKKRLEAMGLETVKVHDGKQELGLSQDDYKDDIHPKAEANKKIATVLARSL